MKTRLLIIIAIATILVLSFFVISYDNALDDTPYDVEIIFDEEEYSVSYFVVNGNTGNIEIDIPLDMIDGVWMIYINDQMVDDKRVALDGNKVIVNYGENIESVKLMGYHEIDVESGWITGEDYCSEWCDQNELYNMGCDQPILAHITKNTNLLSDTFDGDLFRVFVGLPDRVTEEKYQECIDFILEKRISIELEPIPEPDTGEFRYGQQECHYTDANGEQNFCVVEGWTKPASELDCEEICKPPPTKE